MEKRRGGWRRETERGGGWFGNSGSAIGEHEDFFWQEEDPYVVYDSVTDVDAANVSEVASVFIWLITSVTTHLLPVTVTADP